MLDSLNDQPIGDYRLRVESLGQARFFDQLNFALYLLDPQTNDKPRSPIFRGLYNAGRPSIYVPAWIDGEFVEDATDSPLPSRERVGARVLEAIAQKLGALVPPGGRFWLAYESFESEGELMRETRAGLLAGIPLVTTPIGFLLFRADCWLGMRDWHFPEGGREGPRKLQGNKAVDTDHRRRRAAECVVELETFQSRHADNDLLQRAQARAKIVLAFLKEILSDKITK
jgi:hypothetical protein